MRRTLFRLVTVYGSRFTALDGSRLLHSSVEPRAGRAPVAFDGGGADAQDLRRLLDREAAEEAQLDEPRLLRVELRQLAERVVEREQFGAALDGLVDVLVYRELLEIVAALLGV